MSLTKRSCRLQTWAPPWGHPPDKGVITNVSTRRAFVVLSASAALIGGVAFPAVAGAGGTAAQTLTSGKRTRGSTVTMQLAALAVHLSFNQRVPNES